MSRRITPKKAIDCAKAVMNMPIENQAMPATISFLRPIRSPMAPAVRAPIMTPIRAYEPSWPATAGSMGSPPLMPVDHQPRASEPPVRSPGRTVPYTVRSKPSNSRESPATAATQPAVRASFR